MQKIIIDLYRQSGILIILYFLMLPTNTSGQEATNPIAKDAAPVLISSRFSFTEGPAVDHRGNIYFTDQPNNKIWKYDTDGKLSLFLDSAGRSNGMYFDSKGNLITCADEKNELWSISPKRKSDRTPEKL